MFHLFKIAVFITAERKRKMNKLFSKVATLSVGLAMAAGVGIGLGANRAKVVRAAAPYDFTGDTVTFSSQGLSNQTQYPNPFTNGQFSVQFAGGTNDGKYYTTGTGIRTYGGGTVTVSVASGYQMTGAVLTFSGTSYAPTATSVLSGDGSITISSAVVTWSGTSTDHFTLTRPSGSGNWRLQKVQATVSASSAPTVSFVDAPSSVLVGDEGTFVAECKNATNPTFTFESSDNNVFEVASNGDYSAKALGAADVTVSMTCDEGEASKTITVVVNGSETMSVASAVSIAAAFDDSQDTTTAYTVLVKGFITSFNESLKDGNYRAIKISDSKVASASASDTIMVFGIYSDNALRTYGILDGEVTFRAKVQNYKGTYELSSITLVAYTDAAIEYAATAYASLQTACNTGVDAVTEEQWADLATAFDALDKYAKAKLSADDVSAYGEDIEHWISRYTILVEKGGFSDFMSRGLVSGSGAFYQNSVVTDNNTMIIVISIAAVSALAFTLLLVFKKRKHN